MDNLEKQHTANNSHCGILHYVQEAKNIYQLRFQKRKPLLSSIYAGLIFANEIFFKRVPMVPYCAKESLHFVVGCWVVLAKKCTRFMTLVKLFFCATWTQPLGLVFCWILAKFHEFGGELIGFKQTSCFVFHMLG